MEILEKLKSWLQTFPQWAEAQLQVDDTAPEAVNCGLFPIGVEELSRKEDLLGNKTVQYRQTFILRRIAPREEAAAAWLMAFQAWIAQQAHAKTAPAFGDVPGKEWIRAEKGRLSAVTQTGTATYEIRIICEYTKIFNC